jgi:hypothetical protein
MGSVHLLNLFSRSLSKNPFVSYASREEGRRGLKELEIVVIGLNAIAKKEKEATSLAQIFPEPRKKCIRDHRYIAEDDCLIGT